MRRIIAVIALGAAVGCSTVDPAPKLKAATSALEAAKAAGAATYAPDLLAQAEKYLSTAQGLIKQGNPAAALQQLSLASAAADDAKMKATEGSNLAKAKELDAQIADLKAKLGK